MNPNLEKIKAILEQLDFPDEESRQEAMKTLKEADKQFTIVEFKLGRTEKIKRTTSVLLEETIKELEEKREDIVQANQALTQSLQELQAAQEQLIQQEKLASLGQLTAGIAHEIKNPLNFVNNFSELSIELIEEVFEELDSIPVSEARQEARDLLSDVKINLEKIYHHGSRADGIVRSMLQHSRGGGGIAEPTDLNEFVKEYVNLAFQGMRAGKNPINVQIDYELDESIGEIPLVQEDFSRVILNLVNNAFDAMRNKLENNPEDYRPALKIKTSPHKEDPSRLVVAITDNGPGIPADIQDKILQPFFTTKKGKEGTGLGLSISNDIVKAHGGTLSVHSKVGEGTVFVVTLPTV